jgi:hypothetical protein
MDQSSLGHRGSAPGWNGHVAIVVSGELYKQKYPVVWGGSIASAQSKGSKTVGEVWNRADRDNVAYYAYGVVACK